MRIHVAAGPALITGKAISVQAGDLRIAVFRDHNGALFALEDRCPHRGAPLSEGILFEEFVACRDHGWSICLRDGQALAPERGGVKTFVVSEADGVIWLELSD
ncbi:MAG: Rieske 2Fe-2S domain-containing protein [Betaproteobacteria bacterium]|nr:Rieske 2Fe-2S domain-containing protein [Betaproteobacteria bacterium]